MTDRGDDTTWVVTVEETEPAGPALSREAAASVLTVGDGRFGTRGSLEGEVGDAVLAGGVYDGHVDAVPHLLEGPTWTALRRREQSAGRRRLDLRTGVLYRDTAEGDFSSLRFAAIGRPGVAVLRAEGATADLGGGDPLLVREPAEQGRDGEVHWVRVGSPSGGISAAAHQSDVASDGRRRVDRLVAFAADGSAMPPVDTALARLEEARTAGVEALQDEQRRAWAERWATCGVEVLGDPELTLGARYAVFQLLCCTPDGGEAAVGARGLSGPAYSGHVFWDSDVFVLGALAPLRPQAARAQLEYRVRRLDAARANARRYGHAGARFPWESAGDGTEVTPETLVGLDGEPVPVRTAVEEEHIVANVAWAAYEYARWTGDEAFLRGPGRALVTEGARYWASRVERDPSGEGHLRHVMGPDEYHEDVDDNAFTNVMARWHLRLAARLVDGDGIGGTAAEARLWRETAECLVDGYDPALGRHEQFAGFSALEKVALAELMEVPGAADRVLGRDAVRASQVLKQADVLMLHLMVPDEVPPGSLDADLEYYGPRTSHGSSLSPAVHATLLARAGRPDEALPLLRWAAMLDLHGLNGTTPGGLHVATMGGLWRALAQGFAGLGVSGDALTVDPRLPSTWEGLTLRLTFRGAHVLVRAGHGSVEVSTDAPLLLALPDGTTRRLAAGSTWQLGM
ncbi:MAG TPA: glycosyl hydrolase family 65 protein [Jiangellales bacterium]|nr:glycosyl hydrolase family 65 protein [Jiangellales bacterium]